MINIATLPPAATGNNGPIRSPSPVLRAHTHIIDSFIIASQLRRRGRGRRGGEAGRKVGEGGGVGGGERGVVRIKPPPPYRFYYSGIASRQKSLTAGLGTTSTMCVCVHDCCMTTHTHTYKLPHMHARTHTGTIRIDCCEFPMFKCRS